MSWLKEADVTKKRSPIREKPLHVPGQSIDETIARLWDDRGVTYAMGIAAFLCVALFEWYEWALNLPRRPWVISIPAALVVAYCLRGLFRLRRQTRLLEQGRDGERAVAEALDELREDGCRVFHDIVGDGFNVDHVVISSHGIFVVETKAISKPLRAGEDVKVRVEGNRIMAGAANLGSTPITQAEANSRWVRNLLKESTGKSYPVKPCVVFPGWFVGPMPKGVARKVWVLNPTGLVYFIQNEAVRVMEPDIHLAASHLSLYIRSPWRPSNSSFAAKVLAQGRRSRSREGSGLIF